MSKFPLKLFLASLLILLLGIGGYLWVTRGRSTERYSSDEFQRLLDERTVALALMENLETDAADQAWVDLSQEIPGQLMPVRNLAVTRLLSLDFEERVDIDPVKAAFSSMVELEEQSAPALWLYSQLVMHEKISPPSAARDLKAQELLSKAAAQAPTDIRYWFAIFEVGRNSSDEGAQAAGYAALEKAWELQPNNIHVLIARLLWQAERQDSAIQQTIAQAKKTFGPLEAIVQRGSRRSIAETIGNIEEALAVDDWPMATGYVKQLRNIVQREEIAKWDLSIISAHPLDFAVTDFDEDFYGKRPQEESDSQQLTVKVNFKPTATTFPEEIHGAEALEIVDFDLDGELELVALANDRIHVLRSDGQRWQTLVRVDLPAGMRGMALADLDRDRPITSLTDDGTPPNPRSEGDAATEDNKSVSQIETDQAPPPQVCHEADLDLVVYGEPGVLVFRNQSTPEQCRIELVAQSEEMKQVKDVLCAAMVDFDHDADVDLVLSTKQGVRIWSLGGATLQYDDLTQWTEGWPVGEEDEAVEIVAMEILDYERDIDMDLLCSDAAGKSLGLLENLRHGRFAWRSLDGADGEKAGTGGHALAVVDNDGDRSWDVIAANASGVRLLPTTYHPHGVVRWKSPITVYSAPVQGMRLLDYDNDTYRDILLLAGDKLQILRGKKGSFDPIESLGAEANAAIDSEITAVAVADLDRDGDQDVLVITKSGGVEVLNDGGNKNYWLAVHAMGRDDNKGRANHTGIGSLLEVKAGGRYQRQVVTSQTTHFGLGTVKQPSALRILWTNGVPQSVVKPTSNLVLCEPMILKGSCPYVYTWTGERFEFFTDLLWASPIGLQLADGVVAPSRPWEYLKVPGKRLQEQDGKYTLQITEELWEAAYFDQVGLIVVDHPEEVDIFSNEKVGPPSIAEYKIHTVTDARPIVGAKDQRNRDVLRALRRADDQYVKAFDRRHWQGLTEPHYIELDLGDLNAPTQVTLFLTGWIYPSDTSLNVGFTHDSSLEPPKMPSLWAPDADGAWREVQSYMGFPGGKTKTIAVDVSDAFVNNDYRLQIRTNAEIYWDHAFFTVDEPTVKLQTTQLKPESANLHFRGFSARRWTRPNAPESFDYDRVRTSPIWPPMKGRFTRYGEVSPLLQASDDQLVVMGAGDEMTLQFTAPPPPPDGWKRDFLLHSVGWDKDADLNTYYGQSSEPLPFQAMKSYPFTVDDQPPESAEYKAYLNKYQTRRQRERPFWKAP